jgi:hypothetical protein
MEADKISINRAPVLTLWAAVVAERMGYDEGEALSLGKAVAGLNAQAKGRSLGIYGPPKALREGEEPKKRGLGEEFWVEVCGRPVPAKKTEDGIRAVVGDKPVEPAPVEKYLAGKFGEALDEVRAAMAELAAAYDRDDLAEAAYGLYETFRPTIATGKRGWGQKGDLDLGLIRSLAKKKGKE